MISTSFRVALSALFFAGALGLAATGAARAESVMKECGDEWKVAKANGSANGMTWQEFLKQCRTQKESSAAPAAAPAPAPAPAQTYQPKPVPAQTAARATGAGQFTTAGGSAGALPGRQSGLGQHQVPHLSLRRHAQLRHDEAGRLYVRSRRQRRGRPSHPEPCRSAEAAAVSW